MARVIYIAKRNTIPTHDPGTQYELIADLTALNESGEGVTARQVSLSGLQETIYFRTDRIWSFQVSAFRIDRVDKWREFLESTAGGEVFYFNPEGIQGNAPPVTQPLQRVGDGYVIQSIGRTHYSVEFQAREAG